MEHIHITRYPAYRDSGVEWLGKIPAHWIVKKLKYSDSVNMGQSPDSEKCNINEIGLPFLQGNAEFGNLYPTPKLWCEKPNKIANKDDILLSVRAPVGAINFAKEKTGIGRGLCAITAFNTHLKFLYYLVKNQEQQLLSIGTGSTFTAISASDVRNIELVQPPLEEQTRIADFLDRKTAQIDTATAQKERLIALLHERRQILTHNAVTRGLNPDASFKDSGIVSLGQIPTHWKMKRLKYLLRERNERSESGAEPLFMMSQVYGLVVRADYHDKAEVAHSSVGNKKVYEGDLVFNKLKAHLGVFFRSNIKEVGLVSPDYAVY